VCFFIVKGSQRAEFCPIIFSPTTALFTQGRHHLFDVQQVVGCKNAFAALRADGFVICWGVRNPSGAVIQPGDDRLKLLSKRCDLGPGGY
jgi:hypothetical protein